MDIGKTNLVVMLYCKACKKNMWYFIPAIFLISFLLLALPSLLLGKFFPGTEQPGLIQDYGALFPGIVGMPFLAFFSIYFINNVPKILSKISHDSSIEITNVDFEIIHSKFNNRVTRKLNNLIIIPAFLINGIWVTIHLNNQMLSWFTAFNSNGNKYLMFNGYMYIVFDTLFYYLLIYNSIYIISNILFLKEISRKARIKVIPLHPDGCGGLANIGKLGLMNSLPILILGFGVVSNILEDIYFWKMEIFSFYHIFFISIYIFISLIFFFLPLYYFNVPMKKEKKETLNKLGSLYTDLFNKTFNSKILNNDSIELLKSLDFIKKSFEHVEKMPIWPFNSESLKRYFLIIISPFSAFVLPVLIEKIINSFFK